jgi:hypothetical protein
MPLGSTTKLIVTGSAKYQNNILYIAIATKNVDGNVNQYSSTLAVEG